MPTEVPAAAETERRREGRRDVRIQATLWMGGTCLFGTVENLSRGGASIRMVHDIVMTAGEHAVLTGSGPLACGYAVRVVGGAGACWHMAFDDPPVLLDHLVLVNDPPVGGADLLSAPARLWRSVVGVVTGEVDTAPAKARVGCGGMARLIS
jgi:hypothetical protein